jgi:acetyl esterase/lipase
MGQPQVLRMDVYEPVGDVLTARPVVLVAFGGSFVTGTREDVAPFCEILAHLGYVAVAMDYRVGFFLPNESSTMHAVMRCVHDMKGCVRYLRKTVAVDGNPYGIDPDRIIVGGVSAGAIGAMHLTYMNEPAELPAALVVDSAGAGGMEGNSGPSGYSSAVMACYAFSGALGDTTWIQPGDQPWCGVHETGDPTVPCFTQEAYAFGIPTGITISGGHDVHERMTHIGVPDCYLQYAAAQHVGYLTYDPEYAMDVVVQFLGRVVCGAEPIGCASMLLDVADAPAVTPAALHLYPSPATDRVFIDLPHKTTLGVFDLQGAEVLRRTLPQGTVDLDVSALPAGIYEVRSLDAGALRARLVKVY